MAEDPPLGAGADGNITGVEGVAIDDVAGGGVVRAVCGPGGGKAEQLDRSTPRAVAAQIVRSVVISVSVVTPTEHPEAGMESTVNARFIVPGIICRTAAFSHLPLRTRPVYESKSIDFFSVSVSVSPQIWDRRRVGDDVHVTTPGTGILPSSNVDSAPAVSDVVW
jgi:hypothetical protein